MLRLAPIQLSLFAWRKPWHSAGIMGTGDRAWRSPDQLLRSVVAYCQWRAGESWRRLSDTSIRNSQDRWDYLTAVRLVESVRNAETRPQLILAETSPSPSPTPKEIQLRRRPRAELADRLMAADLTLNDRGLVGRLPVRKLARMVAEAEHAAAAAERRRV
jgi:hypothetical protein